MINMWYMCGFAVTLRRRAQAFRHFLQMGFAVFWIRRELRLASAASMPRVAGFKSAGMPLRYDQVNRLKKRMWLRRKGQL